MSEYNIIQEALACAHGGGNLIDVFFRDDDADDDLPNLHMLLDTFRSYNAAINLAVIPGTLSSSGARVLNDRREATPTLVELAQHGWMHVNHESSGRKCEFGATRSYAQQLDDIANGRERLAAMLGESSQRLFVPPWNRCNAETVRVLSDLEFAVISRDESAAETASHALAEIPVTFDINTWKSGPELKPLAEIATALARQVRVGKRIGILLHHKVMTREAFDALDTLLAVFTQFPNVRIHTLTGIVNNAQQGTVKSCAA